VIGGTEKFQTDPHLRGVILFNEYFHGGNGADIGANHQTGCIRRIIQVNGFPTKEMLHDADYQARMIRGFIRGESGTIGQRT
jgi:hypothetical protein